MNNTEFITKFCQRVSAFSIKAKQNKHMIKGLPGAPPPFRKPFLDTFSNISDAIGLQLAHRWYFGQRLLSFRKCIYF